MNEAKIIQEMAERVRGRRKELRLSVLEASLLAGVHEQTLYSVEEGQTKNPGVITLARIADALMVSPGWLVYGEKRNG